MAMNICHQLREEVLHRILSKEYRGLPDGVKISVLE